MPGFPRSGHIATCIHVQPFHILLYLSSHSPSESSLTSASKTESGDSHLSVSKVNNDLYMYCCNCQKHNSKESCQISYIQLNKSHTGCVRMYSYTCVCVCVCVWFFKHSFYFHGNQPICKIHENLHPAKISRYNYMVPSQ